MPRAWKSPVTLRDTAPTSSAQQLTPTPVRRLWFCIWLPNLSLEACQASDEALAIVEDQHGIHRVLQADSVAAAAGVMPGQSANAALALLPALRIEERSPVREQQVLEALATWLERFSSFVSIAGKDVLLLEIAGSLRLFGGLPTLRRQVSQGLRAQGFSAAMAIAPTPLAATWLARAGTRACIRAEENLGPALRKLPLSCLDWPGFARRFGAERLLELDRALGHLPDPRDSWRAPERFCVDYEMAEEQSDSALLLQICRELLFAHEQFLLARQLGTQRLCFSFFHLKNAATELRLGAAFADRSAERWFDLLKIRFESVRLPEAVIAVRLRSGLSQPLQAETARLCFENKAGNERRRYALAMVAEHRPEYAWKAQDPLSDWSASTLTTRDGIKRPLWMLPEPALLPADSGYPLHKGCRLTLLEGPERLETGWWDEQSISRDYYTAVNAAGNHLWVFRNRQRTPDWYLHGIFG